MKTLINESYFESIRDSFKKRDVAIIKKNLMPLLNVVTTTAFISGKLRFHPLGFIYCKLYEYSNKETLRIHIWNSQSQIQQPIMNIHNHFYDVNSFVLCGQVFNDLYEMDENSSPTHCVYSGSYLNESTRILTKSSLYKNLKLIDRQIILKDNLYSIKKSEIHAGGNSNDGVTITIVFSENPGNPEPLVFGPKDGNEKYFYESTLVDDMMVETVKIQIASID